MKTDQDEQSRDPQSTLPPRHSRESPDGTRGRRLILGTPKVTSTAATPPTASDINRGFTFGKKPNVAAAPSASKHTVQPWILVLAGVAVVLLLVALLFRPSGVSSAEGVENERLLAQYTKYLETKGDTSGSVVNEKRKEAVSRLQAVAWAKAVGDNSKLETELTSLLFLDNDKSSPLYQYSVSELKELGSSKKRTGL
jgi:hypothetical protein